MMFLKYMQMTSYEYVFLRLWSWQVDMDRVLMFTCWEQQCGIRSGGASWESLIEPTGCILG